MTITLWLSPIECKEMGLVNKLILILGDNTSAIHWIVRSSLPKTSMYWSTVLFIARKVATLGLESNNFIIPQHLPGTMNSIINWLSFEGEDRMKHDTKRPVQNPISCDYPPNDVVSNKNLSFFSQLVPVSN